MRLTSKAGKLEKGGRRDPSHPEGRKSSRGRESLSRKKATKKTCHRGGSASIRFANVSNFRKNILHRTLSIVLLPSVLHVASGFFAIDQFLPRYYPPFALKVEVKKASPPILFRMLPQRSKRRRTEEKGGRKEEEPRMDGREGEEKGTRRRRWTDTGHLPSLSSFFRSMPFPFRPRSKETSPLSSLSSWNDI